MGEQEVNSAPAAGNVGFIEDAKGVLQEVRTSIYALVDAVGADASQPQEMARRFSLDKTLTWKIARIVGSEDTWSAAAHIPGRAGLRTFIEALERAGAPPERAESVREAMVRFEELIERHSGDRDTFEIMLGGVSDHLARKQGEAFRKMAYLGNSAIWGVQARAQVSVHLMCPSRTAPDLVDYGIICGLMDFRRLRQDVPWAVSSQMSYTDEGRSREHAPLMPMDPALSPTATPILRDFCSAPLPQIRTVEAANKTTRYEFTEGPVGHTASATCILGWLMPETASRYRTPADHFAENTLVINTPVETLYHDVYVHRDLNFTLPPKLLMYSRMPGGPVYPFDGQERGQLQVTEDITDLGSPPDTMVPGVPRYAQLVSYATERLGHPVREFHGFRFRLRYPPVPSLVLFRFELPPKP
jgi:hypothetical protein